MRDDITVIRSEHELAKILAFIRVRVRGKKFVFASELLGVLLSRLENWAEENDVRLEVSLVEREQTTTFLFGVGGAMAGAAAGYALSGSPLIALGGAAAGAVVGVTLAHVRLAIRMDGGQGTLVLA